MNEMAETRQCPYCKEEIKAEAIRCKHCRSSVAPEKASHGGTCPYCRETVHPDAIKCKHCGASLAPAGSPEGGCQGCGEAPASRSPQAVQTESMAAQPPFAGTGPGSIVGAVPLAASSGCGPCEQHVNLYGWSHGIGTLSSSRVCWQILQTPGSHVPILFTWEENCGSRQVIRW